MKTSIYKTPEAKAALLKLYEEKLASCKLTYEDVYVETFAGKTHVIVTGDSSKPPLVVLHGINAGAPLALEALTGLAGEYRIYAIDTVGQVGKSAETRLNTNNDDYGRWLSETMDELKLSQASVIGISYGGFLLQKLMQAAPQKITKGIFVVPGGFVNGPFFKSMLRLSFPLIRFLMTKSEKNLLKFMDAFYISKDAHSVAMQKHVLLGVKVDFNRPPLLKPSDVYKLEAPVYALVADDDIFFPGNKTLERCRLIFKNFKGSYVLKNTRHIPDISRYKEIEVQIRSWLSA